MKGVVVAAVILVCAFGVSFAEAQVMERQANVVAEWSFTSSKTYADPFNEVALDAVFTLPSGAERRVPAFWAGGSTWRVRYASPEVGTHRFATVCSDAANADLHGVRGTLAVTPYTGDNPLYRHGPVRVSSDKRFFEHADGTPFFWLGDTWWMGFTKRLHWPDEFHALTKDRVAKGFTVVQIVAGLYPDMPAFDDRGANEAGFPWEQDYARIRPEYFDHADRRVAHLVDAGLSPCIVAAWGYHLPWLGVDRMKQHWRYLIARYGAYPVFWCTAGEGAMPYYLSADKAKDAEFQKRGWTEIARHLRETDPFGRPITIHPTDLARNQVTDASVLDFEMLQTGHSDRASLEPTIQRLRASRAARPTMPTLNSEVCYEGILGACPADVQRLMTWTSLLAGTAGHTYGANGIWQVNRKEQPYGPSPHGGNWGTTPWDEAMRLPGSTQVGHAKELLQRFEWWRFEPQSDSVEWDQSSAEGQVAWGDWIWHAEGEPAKDAPVGKRWFRKLVDLPDTKVNRAVLHVTADDRFTLFVNGEPAGPPSPATHLAWRQPRRFDVTGLLRPGRNVLAVEAENVAADVPANPAGLLVGGQVVLDGGAQVRVASDATWKTRATAPTGATWTEADFDDSTWSDASRAAEYGDGPWGQLSPIDTSAPPAAAGIDGVVRVIYAPAPQPIRVSRLSADAKWQAAWFDPITGEDHPLPAPTVAPDGSCVIPPPTAQDWVLVLRRE